MTPDQSPSSRRPDLEVSEVTGNGVSDMRSVSTDERWTRHRNDHGNCVECGLRWPCDVALAWRHGYAWGLTVRALEQLQAEVEAER